MSENKNITSENVVKTKKLHQIPSELEQRLKDSSLDEYVGNLGFTCKGVLCDYEGYEKFFERLWVWVKVENDKIYTIVTVDVGNTNCDVVYMDLYIKELVEKINKESN